jgi:hypothetical protein
MSGIDKARWDILSPLLDELLELNKVARARRLAQIGRSDKALADELIGLLKQQVLIRRVEFLEGSAATRACISLR